MTIDEILEKAFAGKLFKTEADLFCEQEQIEHAVFFDKFARLIATGYMEERFTWESSDTAANWLFAVMTDNGKIPDFAFGVFLAFDAGEYHPKTEDLTSDEVTRPLIEKLMAENPVS